MSLVRQNGQSPQEQQQSETCPDHEKQTERVIAIFDLAPCCMLEPNSPHHESCHLKNSSTTENA
eukprot:766573-Hanusia_phi.AAC.2